MIRLLKQYLAIRSYARQLPSELERRYGLKNFYSIEQVTQTVERGGFNIAFVAYAHAIYCDQAAFDAHYGPMQLKCTYRGLRDVVAHRYFSYLTSGFDAAAIIRTSRREEGHFYEGGGGFGGA